MSICTRASSVWCWNHCVYWMDVMWRHRWSGGYDTSSFRRIRSVALLLACKKPNWNDFEFQLNLNCFYDLHNRADKFSGQYLKQWWKRRWRGRQNDDFFSSTNFSISGKYFFPAWLLSLTSKTHNSIMKIQPYRHKPLSLAGEWWTEQKLLNKTIALL